MANAKTKKPEEKSFKPQYFLRQSETLCACGVERSEEDPAFADDLPMPAPWGALLICRNCGALYCTRKAAAEPAAAGTAEP